MKNNGFKIGLLALALTAGNLQFARGAIVGYVNVAMPQGRILICHPLGVSPNNNLNTIMPTPPDGTVVHRFNQAG